MHPGPVHSAKTYDRCRCHVDRRGQKDQAFGEGPAHASRDYSAMRHGHALLPAADAVLTHGLQAGTTNAKRVLT